MHLTVLFIFYLVHLALEIAAFFTIVRLANNIWPNRALEAFDRAGDGVVRGILSLFDAHPVASRLRENVKLALSFGILSCLVLVTGIRVTSS